MVCTRRTYNHEWIPDQVGDDYAGVMDVIAGVMYVIAGVMYVIAGVTGNLMTHGQVVSFCIEDIFLRLILFSGNRTTRGQQVFQ